MNLGHIRFFVKSAGVLLIATATAKLVSALGHAKILEVLDPVLRISYRGLFFAVGGIELAVAVYSLVGRKPVVQLCLIAWLATNFLIYRLALLALGWQKPCGCLGNLTDAIHVPPGTADLILKAGLLYMLVGSYVALYCLWSRRGNSPISPQRVSNGHN